MILINKTQTMSKLRSLSTAFWSDPWIEELSPNEKLLFIYLVTNSKTNMLGIYEASVRKISFETGLQKEDVVNALKAFERVNKVKYSENYVIVKNYMKHQNYNTNMKKSAIDIYNNLPNELKIKGLTVNKLKPSEGFESLSNGYGMVSKREVEYEEEEEIELNENAEVSRAIDLIRKNKPSELETFEMQNKKLVKDWRVLEDSFNDKIDIELSQNKIEWEPDQLMPRFRGYTRSWINNLKNSKQIEAPSDASKIKWSV